MILAKPALALCLGCAFLGLEAAPPPNYYDSAQGKTGSALREALHSISKGQTVILYDSTSNVDTVDALEVLDQDPANTGHERATILQTPVKVVGPKARGFSAGRWR